MRRTIFVGLAVALSTAGTLFITSPSWADTPCVPGTPNCVKYKASCAGGRTDTDWQQRPAKPYNYVDASGNQGYIVNDEKEGNCTLVEQP